MLYRNEISFLKINPIKALASYRPVLYYLLKFGGIFCLLYFGTLAVIGLSTPENQYSPFVAEYLNYIDPLRSSILTGSQIFLSVLGYPTVRTDQFTLAMPDGGEAVRMVYSCIGYGVTSFWMAFVLANKSTLSQKIIWLLTGTLILWMINILRISLLLLALKKSWQIPFGWDHHTWFNILAYSFIFLMIYFYDRANKTSATKN